MEKEEEHPKAPDSDPQPPGPQPPGPGARDPFRRIVWPLAIAETIVWAAMFYSFPALILAWERDLGWSKTELSGAFTLALVVSALMAPLVGRLIDRGYLRQVFAGSAAFGALLLALLSQVTEPWQFYAIWIGLGAAMSGSLYEACFAVLTHVMGPRAKQAITLVTLVAGFAGTVSFPTAHILGGLFGWRGAVLVLAAAVLVLAVPLIWFACRSAEVDRTAHAVASPKMSEALRVMRRAVFWLLALLFGAIALGHGILLTHLLPLLNERGVQAETAVLAAAMIGPMQVAGRLAMMAAERHVSTLMIFVACLVAMILAAAFLFGAGSLPTLLVGFVLFQGAGYGVTSIVRPVIVAEFLGRRNYGVVAGFLAVPYLAGSAAAATVAALVWEAGGYDSVILLAIATAGLGLVLLLTAAALSVPTGRQE